MVPVGDDQLETDRLEVGGRVADTREPVQDGEQRVDLAQVPEQRRAGPGDVDHLKCRRGRLLRADRLRDRIEPLIGNRHGAE